MAKTHELKTWPEYFNAIAKGEKTFEVRKNDRDFQVNDILVLQEYDPMTKKYTGVELTFRVGYILYGMGVEGGYCVMALANALGPS